MIIHYTESTDSEKTNMHNITAAILFTSTSVILTINLITFIEIRKKRKEERVKSDILRAGLKNFKTPAIQIGLGYNF